MTTIMIVDDHEDIRTILTRYAEKEGYAVVSASNGVEALTAFRNKPIDLILLDVMMPGLDGFAVCKELRKQSDVPIIMITARSEDYDRIMGLDNGADDYIVKPFSPGEVMARIRALLRRIHKHSDENEAEQVERDGLAVNLDAYSATWQGEPIRLSRKELALLWMLLRHPNRVFTRDQLLESVWGMDYDGDPRTVDTHITRLRKKLTDIDARAAKIETVRGVGYKWQDGVSS